MVIGKMTGQPSAVPNYGYQVGAAVPPNITLKDRLLGVKEALVRCNNLSSAIDQALEPTPAKVSTQLEPLTPVCGILQIATDLSVVVTNLENTLEILARRIGTYS